MMDKYTSITYKNKPKTNYPKQLVEYLFRSENRLFNSRLYDKVLDLGSGRGDFLPAFWVNQFKVEGFDICPPSEELKAYNVTLGNLEKPLPYKNNQFDIVFCKSVIEHLYYPEKLFKEVNRILKPEGAFVVMVPDWDSTKEIFYRDFTHRSPFTLNSLREIFEIYSFKKIRYKKFRQLPFLWKYPQLNWLSDIFQLFYTPDITNKLIKFSKEKMLLGVGIK